MSTFDLYLILTLPSVGGAFLFLTIIGLVTAGVLGLVGLLVWDGWTPSSRPDVEARVAAEHQVKRAKAWKWAARLVGVAAVSALLSAFVPSTNTVLALLAYNAAGNIEGLDQLPQEAADYLRAVLRDETAKLTEAE